MTESMPQEIQALGALQAEYRSNRLTARILLGTGIFSILVSLFLFATAISRSRAPRSGVLSDSFMLLLAIFFFVYHRYHNGLRVDVYTGGFVAGDWRQALICRWDEVTALYESITHVTHQASGRQGPRRWEYTVWCADGQRIKIAGLEGIVQLGQTLKTEISKHVLRRSVASYRAGRSVEFGPHLRLSRRGISDGTKTLPWHEVAHFSVNERDNGVTIRQQGKHRVWKYVNGSQVANARVLKVMVDRIEELNRAADASGGEG